MSHRVLCRCGFADDVVDTQGVHAAQFTLACASHACARHLDLSRRSLQVWPSAVWIHHGMDCVFPATLILASRLQFLGNAEARITTVLLFLNPSIS